MKICRRYIQSLTPASSSVYCQLKRENVVCLGIVGGLVIHDGKVADHASLTVKDYIGPTVYYALLQMEFKGSLGFPYPQQFVAVITKILGYERPCPFQEVMEGRMVRKGKIEFLLKNPFNVLGSWKFLLTFRDFRDLPENMMDRPTISKFGH